MALDRPHLSITLPRNFTFHYRDGELPKTPEPQLARDDDRPQEPPQLSRQAYRVRRRRPTATFQEPSYESQNIPIPSIETSEVPSSDSLLYHLPEPVEGLLKPNPTFTRFFSPPKTPEAQMISGIDGIHQITPIWARTDSVYGDSISRPSSSGSGVSDSSVESFPSLGGSCTSPESDTSDPFLSASENSKPQFLLTSFEDRQVRRSESNKPINFTKEMDDHIWRTYLRVLQDPTATPYKTLPGMVPPSGIQSRVARVAKKTWRGPRSTSSLRNNRLSSECVPRAGSPDTIKAAKSGSNTPTGAEGRRPYAPWPAEGITRRRFRLLCRAKPSLSAHYQRLLHRSPSPFLSSPQTERRSSRPQQFSSDATSTFSTRDMHVSLTTSMAPSMQAGNPLSQLAQDNQNASVSNDEWFGQPMARASAHQKSQSLQLELGLGFSRPSTSGVLGSPFNPRRSRRAGPYDRLTSAITSTQDDSAPHLHAPAPLPRSFKRRAQYHLDDESTRLDEQSRQSLLNELFGAPAESSHRRVRSRGFSLGDMGEGARRLSSLFTPPITIDASNNMFSDIPMLAEVNSNTAPLPELSASPMTGPAQRLASPFGGHTTNVHFNNTFPRNFSHSFEPATSFEERWAQANTP